MRVSGSGLAAVEEGSPPRETVCIDVGYSGWKITYISDSGFGHMPRSAGARKSGIDHEDYCLASDFRFNVFASTKPSFMHGSYCHAKII